MISVIIPSFNSRTTILNAINSVLKQNVDDLELIVVDDGSTDETEELLAPYKEDGTIRYFYKSNGGASSARNYGTKKAQGEFIGFLDADDIYLPEMLSICLAKINEDGLDLVTVNCYLTYLDSQGNKKHTEMLDYSWVVQPPDEQFLAFMTRGAIGGPHKALFCRRVFDQVGEFDTSLSVYEDLDFWIRVAMGGFRWGHIHKALLECHRAVKGSLFTLSGERNLDCRLKVLKKYQDQAINKSPEMKDVLAEQLWNFGRSYLIDHKAYKKGVHCLWESFCMKPDLKRGFKIITRKIFR